MLNAKANIKKIEAAISRSEHIMLVTHNNPDIDATSSVFASSHLLDHFGKNHTIFFKQNPAKYLIALDPYKKFITEENGEESFKTHDLFIVLDTGDFLHTGIEKWLASVKGKAPIINIDHHETNTFFGDINLVWPSAVSTTEILFDIYKHLDINLLPKIANHLLAGIITDTNNFTNFNTTSKSLETASELIKKGANIAKVMKSAKQKKTREEIQAWGKIFSRLTKNNKQNIAYTIITKEDAKDYSHDPSILDGLSNYLNNISDAKISVLIKEMPDETIKVSLRTNDDLIDVSKFAKMFNGGGHKKAAGFSIKGKLEKTEKGWKIV